MFRKMWAALCSRFDRRQCVTGVPRADERRKMTAKYSDELLRASIADLDRTIVRRSRKQVAE